MLQYQSYGYECDKDGRLALQEPLYPVYSGKVADAVGPCEYDPKIDVKYKSAPKANFGKVSNAIVFIVLWCTFCLPIVGVMCLSGFITVALYHFTANLC
jgi:hypothetical protein